MKRSDEEDENSEDLNERNSQENTDDFEDDFEDDWEDEETNNEEEKSFLQYQKELKEKRKIEKQQKRYEKLRKKIEKDEKHKTKTNASTNESLGIIDIFISEALRLNYNNLRREEWLFQRLYPDADVSARNIRLIEIQEMDEDDWIRFMRLALRDRIKRLLNKHTEKIILSLALGGLICIFLDILIDDPDLEKNQAMRKMYENSQFMNKVRKNKLANLILEIRNPLRRFQPYNVIWNNYIYNASFNIYNPTPLLNLYRNFYSNRRLILPNHRGKIFFMFFMIGGAYLGWPFKKK